MNKLSSILLCILFLSTSAFASTGAALVAAGAVSMSSNHKNAEAEHKEVITNEFHKYMADKLVITCRAKPSVFGSTKNAFSDAIKKCEGKLKQIIPNASLGEVLYIRDEIDYVYIDYEIVKKTSSED